MRSGADGTLSQAGTVIVRRFGRVAYEPTAAAMREFALNRTAETPDEIWLLEHDAVYTQGQAGKPEHVLAPAGIPVVQSDRGGQVTYHGPGQVVAYLLLDIRRLGLGVRALVTSIETAVIRLLGSYGIEAHSRPEAPGVYVASAKIAALGLRVRKGMTYHGLSLNHDMDLTPFAGINPCGYEGLAVTSLAQLGVHESRSSLHQNLVNQLVSQFGYDALIEESGTQTGVIDGQRQA